MAEKQALNNKPEKENTSEVISDLDEGIYDDVPNCPYCGHKQDIGHGDHGFKMDGSEQETECEECEKTYFVTSETNYTFDCYKTDELTRDKKFYIKQREIAKKENNYKMVTFWNDALKLNKKRSKTKEN